MDILILWRANLRRKKGALLSIALLTMLTVSLMAAVLSVNDNFNRAADFAYNLSDCGDTAVFIRPDALTEELLAAVEAHELVGRVRLIDTLMADDARVGESVDGNAWFLMTLRDGILLYNERLDGFEEQIPKLRAGEIYLPLGLRAKLKCGVGDTLTLQCLDGEHRFRIKGFVQEPACGAENIGWKQVFISPEDFAEISALCEPFSENGTAYMKFLMIYRAEDCALSDMKLQRQLNMDTGIIQRAKGALTREQSRRYTGLLQQVLSSVVLVFGGFLFVIVLIVMSHSIASDIEDDYVSLGILKAQGFTKNRIGAVFVLQYLTAELFGIVTGVLLAVPLERVIGFSMLENTAILPKYGISAGKSLAVILVMLLFSAAVILLQMQKLGKVSPVRAIAGGRREIYFDSRLHAPISGRALALTLSLRQFTSDLKRYAGTVFIAAILMFFLLTANLIGNLISSRNALEAMGAEITDIDIFWDKITEWEQPFAEVEAKAASVAPIAANYARYTGYMSINGENLAVSAYLHPEYIHPILRGRAPLYDNELVITDMAAKTLEVAMGDEVVVANGDHEARFLISGIYQTQSDSGMSFALSMEGAKKLGIERIQYMGLVLKEPELGQTVVDALNEAFGDMLTVRVADPDTFVGDSIETAVWALQIMIYVLAVLFILLVVRMVCAKEFARERTDLGIYKALGFTVARLRAQFALRFLVVSLVGAVCGMGLSVLFSAPLLGSFLSLIGFARVQTEYSFFAIGLPVLVMGACFFVFAWLSAGRIRRVEVRELIVE